MADDEPSTPASQDLVEKLASLTELVTQQQKSLSMILGDQLRTENDNFGEANAGNSTADSNDDLANMMMDINNEQDGLSNDADDVALALADVEQSTEYGPDVQKPVADAFIKTVTRPITKETRGKLRKNLIVPNNCKLFIPPKMNQEIWGHLPTKAKLSDLQAQQTQQNLSYGIIALTLISNELSKLSSTLPKETVSKLLKTAMDAGNLMGMHMQDINQKRRQKVKPYISSEYAGICGTQSPVTELLFGDNLSESLKNSKAASSIIRQSMSTGGRNRFRPYPSNKPQSLNWNRPFLAARGRWNGNYTRSSPSFRQPQLYQNLRQPFRKQQAPFQAPRKF